VIPAQLSEEVNELSKDGNSIEIIEAEGWLNVVWHNFHLPNGYSKQATDLLLKISLSYPNGKPDMFWTEEALTLADGRVPQKAEVIENALGKRWRRFSWHAQTWTPATDDLFTYVEFVRQRLAKMG